MCRNARSPKHIAATAAAAAWGSWLTAATIRLMFCASAVIRHCSVTWAEPRRRALLRPICSLASAKSCSIFLRQRWLARYAAVLRAARGPRQVVLIPMPMSDPVAGPGALRFERAGPTVGNAGGVFGLAVAGVFGAFVQPFARPADQFVALAIVHEIILAEDALRIPLALHGRGRGRLDAGLAQRTHRRAVPVRFVAAHRFGFQTQAQPAALHHLAGHLAFDVNVRFTDLHLDDDPMGVVHQQVLRVRQLHFGKGFGQQPRVRIGAAAMRVVGKPSRRWRRFARCRRRIAPHDRSAWSSLLVQGFDVLLGRQRHDDRLQTGKTGQSLTIDEFQTSAVVSRKRHSGQFGSYEEISDS